MTVPFHDHEMLLLEGDFFALVLIDHRRTVQSSPPLASTLDSPMAKSHSVSDLKGMYAMAHNKEVGHDFFNQIEKLAISQS